MNKFNHGSLFSGIGGFDLAAEWMGWNNIFHCEWMPFPRKVLNYHFPKSISYEDITKTNFTIHKGNIDILTGGFPCQPYSQAGKRLGKEDSRHLWPEMLRAIKEIEPIYIVGENVRGLTNWNGGVVFNEVCTDLEDCGYEVQPVLLPACAVGAPHRRDRIWFVAYSNSNGFNGCNSKDEINSSERGFNAFNDINENGKQSTSNSNSSSSSMEYKQQQKQREFRGCNSKNDVTNSSTKRLEQTGKSKRLSKKERTMEQKRDKSSINSSSIHSEQSTSDSSSTRRREDNWDRESGFINKESKINDWSNFPTQSPICGRNDGIPIELDGITFSKWRQESIKGYGNAIVPQVAYQLFKTIQQLENLQNQKNQKNA